MILNFEANLIFLKSPKTASSTIELWLARGLFSGVNAEDDDGENLEPTLSSEGIITRLSDTPATRFEVRPHITMDGAKILLGEENFSTLNKVTSIRNPFDQVFSHFWWKIARTAPKLHHDLSNASRRDVARYFQSYVANLDANWLRIRNYATTSDGRHEVNRVIRYESLRADLLAFAREDLGVEMSATIPRLKAHLRPKKFDYQPFYNRVARDKVARLMEWELERFSYKF